MTTPEPVTELIDLLHLQPTTSTIDTLAGWWAVHAGGGVPTQAERPFVSGGLPPYTYQLLGASLTSSGAFTAQIEVTDADGAKVTKTFSRQL